MAPLRDGKQDRVFSSIPDGIVVIGPDKRILDLNPAAEKLFSVPRPEALGAPCASVISTSLCRDGCPFPTVVRQGGSSIYFDISLPNRASGSLPVCIHLAPLHGEGQPTGGVVEVIRVVSHVKELIEEVQRSRDLVNAERRRLEAVVESVADGVFAADRELRITSFNRAAEEITGYRRREALGKPCHEIFRTSLCTQSCPLVETLQPAKGVCDLEMEVTARNGEKIPVSLSASLLKSGEGEVLGAVHTFRDLRELSRLMQAMGKKDRLEDLVGRHPRMQELFSLIETVAKSDATVLIQGESGTGKDRIAAALHVLSARRAGPFIKVSCAALPETLLESELFGHIRGAFTGAVRDKPGRFEMAHGGTIFLDEIGEVSPAIQVKLLRVLQEKAFEPLGGVKTIHADLRIIAATNRDLRKAMQEGKFREDLYYRLNVVPIFAPPLRERREDIPLLAAHILKKLGEKTGRSTLVLSPQALESLVAYDWPGNVREMENALEFSLVSTPGSIVRPSSLPPWIAPQNPSEEVGGDLDCVLADREKDEILRRLAESGGRQGKAARLLGISRTTLWRRMRRHGLASPARRFHP